MIRDANKRRGALVDDPGCKQEARRLRLDLAHEPAQVAVGAAVVLGCAIRAERVPNPRGPVSADRGLATIPRQRRRAVAAKR